LTSEEHEHAEREVTQIERCMVTRVFHHVCHRFIIEYSKCRRRY